MNTNEKYPNVKVGDEITVLICSCCGSSRPYQYEDNHKIKSPIELNLTVSGFDCEGDLFCFVDDKDIQMVYKNLEKELELDTIKLDSDMCEELNISTNNKGKSVILVSEHNYKTNKNNNIISNKDMRCFNFSCGEWHESVLPNFHEEHFLCYRCRSQPLTLEVMEYRIQIQGDK